MYLDRAEREELNALSKEIFGQANRWRKLVEKGYSETLTRTVVEEVPGENGAPPTTKESKVALLTNSGGKQSRIKYLTLEEVKNMMLDLKAQKEAYLAAQKEQQAKEATEKEVIQNLTGSAL